MASDNDRTDSPPAAPQQAPSHTQALASTIAAAVERQLTQFASVMSQQIDAVRRAAAEAQSDLEQRLAGLAHRIDAQQQSTEAYQRALQAALEERLAEFANHQHLRLVDLDAKLAQVPQQMRSEIPAQVAAATGGLREYLEHQTAALDARIGEVQRHAQRFDEQVAAMVQHVNQTIQMLAGRIDDTREEAVAVMDERLNRVRAVTDQTRADLERQLAQQLMAVGQRVDTVEMKATDRMLEMEQRINDHAGSRFASIEADLGRLGSGFDTAVAAVSQRVVEAEERITAVHLRLDEMAGRLEQVDADALEEMKERLSSAVGEAMLVRIELDRVVASTDEKLDKQMLRMSEIEALLTDEMDVSAAVQLERLDELERAIAALDPDQFVRKVDPTAAAPGPRTAPPSAEYGTPHEPTLTF